MMQFPILFLRLFELKTHMPALMIRQAEITIPGSSNSEQTNNRMNGVPGDTGERTTTPQDDSLHLR